MWHLAKRLSLAVGCLTMVGCSEAGDQSAQAHAALSEGVSSTVQGSPQQRDITPFLAAVGFNDPLTITVNLRGVRDVEPTGIRHTYLDGTRSIGLVALLYRTGQVRPMSDPTATPWWRMNSLGADSTGMLTVPLGRRVVTGRSNRQTWSEGATSYVAETITYRVERSANVSYEGAADFGSFSFRVVLVNHPAVGHWQVDQGLTPRLGADVEQVARLLSAEGMAEIGQLAERIRQVRDAGVEQQQREQTSGPAVPPGGSLRLGPYPNTILSRSGELLWYTGHIEVSGRQWRDLDRLCATVPISEISSWRAPSEAEVRTLLVEAPRPGGGRSVDLRLAGERLLTPAVPPYVAMGPNGVHPRHNILLRDLYAYNGPLTTLAAAEPGRLHVLVWFERWTRPAWRRDQRITRTPGDHNLGPNDRLICVAER